MTVEPRLILAFALIALLALGALLTLGTIALRRRRERIRVRDGGCFRRADAWPWRGR